MILSTLFCAFGLFFIVPRIIFPVLWAVLLVSPNIRPISVPTKHHVDTEDGRSNPHDEDLQVVASWKIN